MPVPLVYMGALGSVATCYVTCVDAIVGYASPPPSPEHSSRSKVYLSGLSGLTQLRLMNVISSRGSAS